MKERIRAQKCFVAQVKRPERLQMPEQDMGLMLTRVSRFMTLGRIQASGLQIFGASLGLRGLGPNFGKG